MKRTITLGLTLCAAVACAQTTPTGPVKLELNLKAGQTRTYRLVNETVLSTILPGVQPKKSTTRQTGTFDLIVDSVNPDGSYAVRVRPLKQALSIDGKDITIPDGSDAEVKATLTRDGLFREVTGKPQLKEGAPAAIDGEEFLSTVFDDEAPLPSQALSVGDTWKDKVESPLDESQEKISVNGRLVGLDVVDGAPVARVLRVICDTVPGPKDEPGITMNGKLEGGGLVTYELKSGLTTEERDAMRLTMEITAQNPANESQKVTIKTIADITVRIQASPASGPA